MARSIEEQTGWRRFHPQQICQEREALLRVCEFDFDLRDPAFREYLRGRGVCDFVGVENPLQVIAFNQDWTEEEVFRDIECARPEAYRLTEEDRHGWVLVWRLLRAKCQDAWELFKGVSVYEPAPVEAERVGQLDLFAA